MRKLYLLIVILMSGFVSSFGQTIGDVKKLGLTDTQLRNALEKRQVLLKNKSTGKRRKLKEGTFATVVMKGDTTRFEYVLEAFLSDTIIVSSLAPQLKSEEISLAFAEFRLLYISDIQSITFSARRIKGIYWTSFLMTLTGLEMAILPVIIPLITGNMEEVYSQPQFPFIVAGGVVLFIGGKILQKKLIPKEYDLINDWGYTVIRK